MTPRYQAVQTWPCPACAEPIRVEANVCKHCGARMEDYDAEPAPAVIETSSSRFWRRHWWIVAIIVVALVSLWARGTFDHLLLNVGLNAKSCGRNLEGAVLCGKELDELHERLQVMENEERTSALEAQAAEEAQRRASAAEARRLEEELGP
jgi:predicted amidophosphoribosyltransferase